MDLKQYIDIVEDFPSKGVSFKDISPLLKNPVAYSHAINKLAKIISTEFFNVHNIAAIESRGFIFAAPIAFRLGLPLILVRKEGKLPPLKLKKITSKSEYATVPLEVREGQGRTVIIDDVLATGGTIDAAKELLETAGYSVSGALFLINLTYLNDKTNSFYKSLISY